MSDALPPEPRASKPAVVRALLEHGSVYVHLDARVPEVDVPAAHREDFRLVLQLGWDLQVPIPDLDIGDDFLTATLSFSRRPYRCRVPWRAVFAVTSESGAGMVWPESFPAEVRREFIRAMNRPTEGAAMPHPVLGTESRRAPASAAPASAAPPAPAPDTRTAPARPETAPVAAPEPAAGRPAAPGAADAPPPPAAPRRSGRAGDARARRSTAKSAPVPERAEAGSSAAAPPRRDPTPPPPGPSEIRRGHLRLVK